MDVEAASEMRRNLYTEHFVARIFLMRTVCQEVLSGSHPSLTFHALAWLKMKLCAFSKTDHTWRNMSYITPELTSTISPCTARLPQLLRVSILASDPQQASIGNVADVRTCTGYEPKDLAENDDLCVKPVFFHRPSISWTYDSAENIATPPPDSDLDDEQIRALLASRLYLKGREASADRKRKLGVKFI